jgi:hypothetical protein
MKGAAAVAIALLAAAPATAKPVKTERVSNGLEFSYEWPQKAQTIKGLHAYLKADLEKAFRQASADAADDQSIAHTKSYPFRQHSYSMSWDSEGEADRFISLEGDLAWDSNGAHPNSSTKALLWDRHSDRKAAVSDIFSNDGAFAEQTRKAYCKALDAERARRREGEKLEGEFAQCPAYKELAILLVDRNHDHRFDHILFVAPPYVAGPYVEGQYEISLPVTARLVAAMKPDYRSSFQPQRQ